MTVRDMVLAYQRELAITKLEEALHWLNARTNRREGQNVEGTHEGN